MGECCYWIPNETWEAKVATKMDKAPLRCSLTGVGFSWRRAIKNWDKVKREGEAGAGAGASLARPRSNRFSSELRVSNQRHYADHVWLPYLILRNISFNSSRTFLFTFTRNQTRRETGTQTRTGFYFRRGSTLVESYDLWAGVGAAEMISSTKKIFWRQSIYIPRTMRANFFTSAAKEWTLKQWRTESTCSLGCGYQMSERDKLDMTKYILAV